MSFRRLLRLLLSALLGALTAASPALAKQPIVVPTGNWPYGTYVGDFDGDGKQDLAFTRLSDSDPNSTGLFIAYGNGDGTFTAPIQQGSINISNSLVLTVVDVDHDGISDFVFVQGAGAPSYDSIATVWYGTSARGIRSGHQPGSFQQPGPNHPGYGYIAALDVNGDGQLDIVALDIANSDGYVLVNNGDGSFTSKFTFPLTGGGGFILAGDFNGDGKSDFLLNNQVNDTVTPYYGGGDGTFTVGTPYTLQGTPPTNIGGIYSMLVKDIDGDGIPDLVVEGYTGTLSYFPGTATGFSTTALPIYGAQDGPSGQGGHLVAIADLNGDGFPDIVTSTPAGISVLLGQAPASNHVPYTPSYVLLDLYNAGPGRSSYALADFNSDGRLDLAIDSPEGVAIFFGAGGGSFQASRSFSARMPVYSADVGQFTGSGNTDAVVSVGFLQLELLIGDGVGGFPAMTGMIPATSFSASTIASSIFAGDFNGDIKLDAALIPILSPSAPFSGNPGGGVFTVGSPSPILSSLAPGNGDGAFPGVSEVSGYGGGGTSAVGDFDGDGASDFASFSPNGCSIYPGKTFPTNPTVVAADPALGIYNTGAAGFLKTGRANRQDLVCQFNTGLQVYRNNGDGTFTKTTTLSNPPNFAVPSATGTFATSGLFPSTVLLADLDGDGNGDVIVVYHNLASDPTHPVAATANQLYIYWGKGDGTFSSPLIQPLTRNFYQAIIAGSSPKPELVLSDGYLLSILRGDADRTFNAEKHFLAGMGINSISLAPITGYTALLVANGGAFLTNLAVNHGTLATNAEVDTGGITVLFGPDLNFTVDPTGTLTASPEPSDYAADITLTATLTPPASGTPATGSVTFSIDGVVVGTGNVTNNVATYTVTPSTYPPGVYALTAVYSGDDNYNNLNLTGSHTVSLQPSHTTLTNLLTPIYYGQTIGDNPNAAAQAFALNTPNTGAPDSGTITVYLDGVNSCVLTVGPTQQCPDSTGAGYAAGVHTIYLIYSGNQYYLPSMSVTYSATVLPDITNPGTLTSSLNPATAGQQVTFTAIFTAPFATPTGTVTFYDGSTAIGTGMLDATGTATFITSILAVGPHTITATLAASLNFLAAATQSVSQQINPRPFATLTTLTSSVNPSMLGQNVTFTATVGTVIPVIVNVAGTVTFTADGVTIGSGTVAGGIAASVSTSTLTLGDHNIVATYSGSSGRAPSTSATLVQQVNTVGTFSLTVTPSPISVPIGNTTSVIVTVTPLNGFNQPVQLTCANLPRETTCLFENTTIPTGGGTTQLLVSATAPHTCGTTEPYFVVPSGPTTWFGIIATGSLIFLLRRRRRLVKGIILTLALCILPALTNGCSTCTDLGVEPGTYSFTVTGTSTGTPPATASQTVQMVAHL